MKNNNTWRTARAWLRSQDPERILGGEPAAKLYAEMPKHLQDRCNLHSFSMSRSRMRRAMVGPQSTPNPLRAAIQLQIEKLTQLQKLINDLGL